jgi:hypothetical protein
MTLDDKNGNKEPCPFYINRCTCQLPEVVLPAQIYVISVTCVDVNVAGNEGSVAHD